jgi:hypothetical protein
MIRYNTHTADGVVWGDKVHYNVHSNDQNFQKIVDLYNVSSPQKKAALAELFSVDFSNIPPIEYKENKYGFRSPYQYRYNETDDCMWVFGDSISYGHGINYENTWPYLLSNNLNLKLYNFSCCGTGIDTSIRLLQVWLQQTVKMPKLIISYGFYPSRYEISALERQGDNHIATYETIRNDVEIAQIYNEKLKYFISLMEYAKCPFYNIDFLNSEYGWNKFYIDFARDIPLDAYEVLKNTNHSHYKVKHFVSGKHLPHPGIKSNQAICEYISTLVK